MRVSFLQTAVDVNAPEQRGMVPVSVEVRLKIPRTVAFPVFILKNGDPFSKDRLFCSGACAARR